MYSGIGNCATGRAILPVSAAQCSAAVPLGSVPEAFNELDRLLGAINEEIAELSVCLDGVLRPAVPSPVSVKSENDPSQNVSPIAHGQRAFCARLYDSVVRLRELRARVDL